MKRIPMLIMVAALLAALARGAAAQSDQRIVVPLSDPGRAAILEVSLVSGSISVSAYDGDEIVIMPRLPSRNTAEPERPETGGLRRIPNTSMGLTAEERNNTVSIAMDSPLSEIALDISVPSLTSVRAGTVRDGDLTVEGVAGEHELANVNGNISATDIAGSVVANTNNGDVRISLTELAPDKAMSFTSFNGDMDVTFPANLAAVLRISTNRGEVLTDFDVEMQPQTPIVESSDSAGRYRVRLENDVRAVVGGGGPEMYFKSFNGDIVIRAR